MRTLVISDLHLGARSDVDVLRRPARASRRCSPPSTASTGSSSSATCSSCATARCTTRSRPRGRCSQAIGEALGSDGEVVLVPGNHDFRLISPWLEWRSRNGPEPLGLQERAGPEGLDRHARASPGCSQPAVARRRLPGHLARRRRLRHPRPLPRPPRDRPELRAPGRGRARAPAARAGRPRRARPTTTRSRSRRCTRCSTPIAARVGDGRAATPGKVSARAWQRLSPDGSGARAGARRALAGALPAGDRRAQPARARAAEGRPVGRRAAPRRPARDGRGRRAPGHRRAPRRSSATPTAPGPLPDDDAAEWRLAGGAQLHEHRLLGLRVDVPRPRLGQPVLARRAAVELETAASRASCGCCEGVDAGDAQAAGSASPGVKHVA